jgi:peptide/nickel transport system permease protein
MKPKEFHIYIYIGKKALYAIITVFAIISFNFLLFRILPGNPIEVLYRGAQLSPSAIDALYKQFGLNQPLWIQYFIYIKNTISGNLGISYAYQLPVIDVLFPAIINSLILGIPATILGIYIGIWTGKIAGWKRNTMTDNLFTNISMILWAIPGYWLATLLILLIVLTGGVLPVSGMYTPGINYQSFFYRLIDLLKHLVLPLIVLTLLNYGQYTILMRNSLIDVTNEDYIISAKAKGVPDYLILNKHAMPNARLPIVSMIAINLGYLVGGLILTETVFSWPGVGWLIYSSILSRDYPVLQGAFLILAISIVISNFIADMIYLYLDPRIRYG